MCSVRVVASHDQVVGLLQTPKLQNLPGWLLVMRSVSIKFQKFTILRKVAPFIEPNIVRSYTIVSGRASVAVFSGIYMYMNS